MEHLGNETYGRESLLARLGSSSMGANRHYRSPVWWDESGLSAAWAEEKVKSYAKSIVTSLFSAKKRCGFPAALCRNLQPQLDFEVLPAGNDRPHSTSDLHEEEDCKVLDDNEENFEDLGSDEEDEDDLDDEISLIEWKSSRLFLAEPRDRQESATESSSLRMTRIPSKTFGMLHFSVDHNKMSLFISMKIVNILKGLLEGFSGCLLKTRGDLL